MNQNKLKLSLFEEVIIQNGTHKELIGQKDSLYWKLWNTQTQYYR